MARLAETGCVDAFRAFVGKPYLRSILEVTFLSPDSVNWRIADDREVTCFIGEPDGSTTGTLEGAKRKCPVRLTRGLGGALGACIARRRSAGLAASIQANGDAARCVLRVRICP